MNLLDSILLTSQAERYSDNFKKHGLDAFTLKLLNDEDLQVLGVEEEETRSLILRNTANLQITAEKLTELDIDLKYVHLVLSQMALQLKKHWAGLSIALHRNDLIVCDIRLSPAANCLRDCIISLENQLDEFDQVIRKREKNIVYNRKRIISAALLALTCSIITFKLYQRFK